MNKFFCTVVLVLLAVAAFGSAAVRAEDCSLQYGLIISLKPSSLGAYNVWDGDFGTVENTERFVSGVNAPNRTVVAAGERYAHEEAERELILVKMDKRGRTVWHKAAAPEGLQDVVKILPHPKGYLVMANIREAAKVPASIWLGVFDVEGAPVSETKISDRKFGLQGRDIIAGKDDNEFLVAVSVKSGGLEDTVNAAIYRIDAAGKVQSYNGYAPGLQNDILDLFKMPDGSYLASGYIHTAEGRKAGWVLMLNESGSIMWQSQYARGLMASLNAGAAFVDDHIIVAGETQPIGGGESAAWVMALRSGTGNVSWQRYYRGNLGYNVRDVIAYPDGLATVMIDGRAPKGDIKAMPEVRLLTLSPRGTVAASNTYLNGRGANAMQMIQGPNMEHILIGDSKIYHRPKQENDVPQSPLDRFGKERSQGDDENLDESHYSIDGWIVAGPPNDPYTDPCKLSYDNVPE